MGRWMRTRRFHTDESAASSIEYAFLASLIALVIIVSVEAVGISLIGVFTNLLDAF